MTIPPLFDCSSVKCTSASSWVHSEPSTLPSSKLRSSKLSCCKDFSASALSSNAFSRTTSSGREKISASGRSASVSSECFSAVSNCPAFSVMTFVTFLVKGLEFASKGLTLLDRLDPARQSLPLQSQDLNLFQQQYQGAYPWE